MSQAATKQKKSKTTSTLDLVSTTPQKSVNKAPDLPPAFDLAQLLDLKPGDMLELPTLLSGLGDTESVVALAVRAGNDEVEFQFSYLGIAMCRRTITRNTTGEFSWA